MKWTEFIETFDIGKRYRTLIPKAEHYEFWKDGLKNVLIILNRQNPAPEYALQLVQPLLGRHDIGWIDGFELLEDFTEKRSLHRYIYDPDILFIDKAQIAQAHQSFDYLLNKRWEHEKFTVIITTNEHFRTLSSFVTQDFKKIKLNELGLLESSDL